MGMAGSLIVENILTGQLQELNIKGNVPLAKALPKRMLKNATSQSKHKSIFSAHYTSE